MDSSLQEPSVPPLPTPSPEDLLRALRQTEPNRLQVAASLLDRGIDINGVYEFPPRFRLAGGSREPRTQVTALYDAAERGDYEAVQFLLSRGADATAKNRTGMTILSSFIPYDTTETLRALDGMRTSKNMKIVQLAEELYGVETEEEFVTRRDAFDELIPPRHPRPLDWQPKSEMRRVDSVLPANKTQKKQQDRPSDDVETKEKRYNLRARDSNLFYA